MSIRCDAIPACINLKDLAPTIASYRKLVEYGRARGVDVIVENHGSASEHPEQLAEILRESGAGSLPDFGNFPDSATRERGLRLLFPLAKSICHVKRIPELPRASRSRGSQALRAFTRLRQARPAILTKRFKR